MDEKSAEFIFRIWVVPRVMLVPLRGGLFIFINKSQKGFFNMEDADPFALRQLITSALEVCTDTDLLDLIYKILITDSIQ